MQIFNQKLEIYERNSIAKIDQKIHSQRKSKNSERNFGFERTGKINFRVISKNFKAIWK